MKGKIYKITNSINEKVYIGQTTSSLNRRFQSHKYSAKAQKYMNYPLYRAFNKYGIENFSIELIGEYDAEELNDKEILFIKQFDSYKNGYNCTLGGSGWRTVDVQEELVIKTYNELRHIGKTMKATGLSYHKVRQVLDSHNVETRVPPESSNFVKKSVRVIELNLDFDTITECALYLIENGICKTKKIECAKVGIGRAINGAVKYSGHSFQLIKT